MDFKTMTGPQLVAAYNSMVEECRSMGQEAYREVNRFSSTEAGIGRCETIASTLRALREGAAAEARRGARRPQAERTAASAPTEPQQQEGEDDMAKKATKKAAAKPAKKKTKPEEAEGGAERLATGKIADLFEVRAGSNRDKMLAVLIERFSKPVTTAALLEALYGVANAGDAGAMRMVLKGLEMIIASKELPYEIAKAKVAAEGGGRGELTYTLQRKG